MARSLQHWSAATRRLLSLAVSTQSIIDPLLSARLSLRDQRVLERALPTGLLVIICRRIHQPGDLQSTRLAFLACLALLLAAMLGPRALIVLEGPIAPDLRNAQLAAVDLSRDLDIDFLDRISRRVGEPQAESIRDLQRVIRSMDILDQRRQLIIILLRHQIIHPLLLRLLPQTALLPPPLAHIQIPRRLPLRNQIRIPTLITLNPPLLNPFLHPHPHLPRRPRPLHLLRETLPPLMLGHMIRIPSLMHRRCHLLPLAR